jgi:hypothetical protein
LSGATPDFLELKGKVLLLNDFDVVHVERLTKKDDQNLS